MVAEDVANLAQVSGGQGGHSRRDLIGGQSGEPSRGLLPFGFLFRQACLITGCSVRAWRLSGRVRGRRARVIRAGLAGAGGCR